MNAAAMASVRRYALGIAAGLAILVGYALSQGSVSQPAPGLSLASTSPPVTSVAPLATAAVSAACIAQMRPLMSGLVDLQAHVGPDVAFGDYHARLTSLTAAYQVIDPNTLDMGCYGFFEEPAAAFRDYTFADTFWQACASRGPCPLASVQRTLQPWLDRGAEHVAVIQLRLASPGD